MKAVYKIAGMLLVSACIFAACIEDNSNFKYTTQQGNLKLSKRLPKANAVGATTFAYTDRITFAPQIELKNPDYDTTNLEFKWYFQQSQDTTKMMVFDKKTFTIPGDTLGVGSYIVNLIATDPVYKMTYTTYFSMNITSEFSDGWIALVDKNGVSELSYITLDPNAGKLKSVRSDLYQSINDAELGSGPEGLTVHHYKDNKGAYGYTEILVRQSGGQKAVEIDASSMLKAKAVEDEFKDKAIPGGNVRNIVYNSDIGSYLISEDGKVYMRDDIIFEFVNDYGIPEKAPVLHAAYYSTVPMYFNKGMNITKTADFARWHWGNYMMLNIPYEILYDELNHRLLSLGVGSDVWGMMYEMNEYGNDPGMNPGDPADPSLPDGLKFPRLEDLSQYEVHSMFGCYNDGWSNYMDVGVVMKNRTDNKYYYLQFQYQMDLGQRDIDFRNFAEMSCSQYINPDSKFVSNQGMENPYSFFIGGEGNKTLYMYNRDQNTYREVYASGVVLTAMDLGITVPMMGMADYGDYLLVATGDGHLLLFDTSLTTIGQGGKPQLIQSFPDAGMIKDIKYMNQTAAYDR